MCRLTGYIGPRIPLENIIVKPRHSLLVQSQDAREAKLAVNGDGFGVAWYGDLSEPGVYKDVLPAWSDSNLPSICRQISSPLFLAHVRASTVGGTSRENCHPFTHGRWSFMHNGGIGNFHAIRRDMETLLADDYYEARQGHTDSELLFYLLLTNGLECNPRAAVETTIDQLLDIVARKGQSRSRIRLTCVFSNGVSIFGFRYSNDNVSPSLYLSMCLDHGGHALASEPLDADEARWVTVESEHLVEVSTSRMTMVPLSFHHRDITSPMKTPTAPLLAQA